MRTSVSVRVQLARAALALVALATAVEAGAGKCTVTSGRWEDPGLWSPAGVPQGGDAVVIASGHTVTVLGPKRVRALTVQLGATLTGEAPGGSVILTVASDLIVDGAIAGAPGAAFPGEAVAGGHVVLAGGGALVQRGTIRGGDGAPTTYGGMVRARFRANILVHPGAVIGGGEGGTPGAGTDGEGGLVDLVAAGDLENLGVIRGGRGGSSRSAFAGPGGLVCAEAGRVLVNTGTLCGGEGGRSLRGVAIDRTGPVVMRSRYLLALRGPEALVLGASLALQSDEGSIALQGLKPGAVQATAGPVTLLTPYELDLTGNPPLPVERVVSPCRVRVLAERVRMDPGVRRRDLIAPVPAVTRRARLVGPEGAVPGRPYRQAVVAPDHPRARYVAAAALNHRSGLILWGFGVLEVEADPLFRLTARGLLPGSRTAGTLDGHGRARIGIPIPSDPALAGVAFYTTALVLDARGPCNLTPAAKVTIGAAGASTPGEVE